MIQKDGKVQNEEDENKKNYIKRVKIKYIYYI